MLGLSLRRGAPLLTVLLACAPTKEDSGGDTSLGDTGAATLGHSSAPTTGDSEATTPTSSVSVSASGTPPDPSTTTTTTTTGEPPPGTITATVTTVPGEITEGDGTEGDGVPFSPVETTLGFIVEPPDLPPGECDPWDENCPAGQKCMPFATPGSPTWDAVKCVPVAAEAAAPGEPCSVLDQPLSGIDNCELHAMCWDADDELHGTCVAMCLGDGFNAMKCDPGETCVKANDNVLLVCLPACDPLLADCAADQVCVPAGFEFACAPDASGVGGQAFTSCEVGNGCDPGLVCASSSHSTLCSADSDECCLPFCDLDAPDACPPGTACVKGGLSGVGICADP